MSGSSFNTTPTPVSDRGLIYVTSGYRTRPIFAIRAGASGDISLADGERSNPYVAWSAPRDGPYITSPLVCRGYLYVVSANGVLTVFQATTGERAYKRRIGDTGGAYSASPIAADGRIYLTSEDGDIFVVRAGPEYELLATNRMGEVCLATPAISEGQMFIRTTDHLLAVTDGIAPEVAVAEGSSSTPFPAELAAGLTLPFDSFEDGICWRTPVFVGKRSPTGYPRQRCGSSMAAPRQPRALPGSTASWRSVRRAGRSPRCTSRSIVGRCRSTSRTSAAFAFMPAAVAPSN